MQRFIMLKDVISALQGSGMSVTDSFLHTSVVTWQVGPHLRTVPCLGKISPLIFSSVSQHFFLAMFLDTAGRKFVEIFSADRTCNERASVDAVAATFAPVRFEVRSSKDDLLRNAKPVRICTTVIQVKGKAIRYRPEEALRVPRGWGSQIWRHERW